jgi:GT2 family glycosyltransferase
MPRAINKETPANATTVPTVAYVVVTWNNVDIVHDCILSIEQQKYPSKKIIVVDNASADNTVSYIEKEFPGVQLLAQKENYRFAKGNNIGIDEALKDESVEHIVLLNSDARLAPNWTSTLVKEAARKPRAATMQSVTLDYYDHGIIDSTHVYLSALGQATQGSFRRPIGYGFDVAPQKVFGCNAAAVLITRKFIETQPFSDLFDETMSMYLEDVDFAMRATVMGWDNYVVPGTRAYHMGSVSSGKNPGFSLYMTFRNNLGLLIKNLPFPLLMKVLVLVLRSDRASRAHLKRTGNPEGAKAIIRGRLASLQFIPIFVLKRRKLKKVVTVDNDYLWSLMRKGF